LIANGLDASKIELVVTDMLAAYNEVIKNKFPNALHQHCVFHFMQLFNEYLKEALKIHRQKHFKEGERKEAHKISLLILKGQEKLNDEEQDRVIAFCELYPEVAQDYALKEDIRMLYALAETELQAVAWKDIIIEQYESKVSNTMQKALLWLDKAFEKTISYLKIGILHAKTNNDAERIMRKIERNQKTHYFFRSEESLKRHLNTRLGIFKIVAT
jgi:transposase-like protein